MWEVKYASDEHDYESVNEMKKKKSATHPPPKNTHTHTYNNAEEKEGWHETSDWGVVGWHNMQLKKKKKGYKTLHSRLLHSVYVPTKQ